MTDAELGELRRAVGWDHDRSIQCVHVTFNRGEEEFYRKCGFHIFGGGIIDFKRMDVDV